MYSDKKYCDCLTLSYKSRSQKKSKANAQGENNMSPKMGKDLHINWWVTDVSNML